jgi:hypothetical protein
VWCAKFISWFQVAHARICTQMDEQRVRRGQSVCVARWRHARVIVHIVLTSAQQDTHTAPTCSERWTVPVLL